MARIFISYNRADRQFVDELVPLLRKVYGQDALWFDEEIRGGVDWWQMILGEINRCQLFIYLLSNDALDSPYCIAEFREALRLRKRVLPVVVRPKTRIDNPRVPVDIAQVLKAVQYVDMSKGFKDYAAAAQLYASVNQILIANPGYPASVQSSQPIPIPPVRKPVFPARQSWLALAGVVTFTFVVALVVLALYMTSRNQAKDDQTNPSPTLTQLDSPVAKITSLQTGAQITGIVTIMGQAALDDFLEYTVEVATTDNTAEYFVIGSFNVAQPDPNSLLATWRTTDFPNGNYYVRVSVISQRGVGYYSDLVWVVVNNLPPTGFSSATSIWTDYPTAIYFPTATLDPFPTPFFIFPTATPSGLSSGEWVCFHVVQSGETMGGIAEFYGTTMSAIAQQNNLTNPNLIYEGQTLKVPC
ncbi:MAG: TIR domain-containing protein [Anaerolineae bacterium]|nr:TIR domain-containing protein [Anaerolineae bacterium]